MTFIRSQERMVAQTIGDYLFTQLSALGWLGNTPPFGASAPITLLDAIPAATAALAPNSMSFTEGPELEDAEGEMGASSGGLFVAQYVFFCDVYGENPSIAKAICSDLKAILSGRLTGTNRYQQMKDYSVTPAVLADGHWIHFEHITVEEPPNQQYQRDWRVVKFTAVHEYNATEYGLSVP